ncbi:hypothetical protein EON79_17390, partial [bacterium]
MLASLGLLASVASADSLLYRSTEDVVAALAAPSLAQRINVWLDHYEFYAGDSAVGYVQLDEPAPEGGAEITLSATATLSHVATVPYKLTIPAGEKKISFPLSTIYSFKNVYGGIQATYAGLRSTTPDAHYHGVTVAIAGNKSSLYGGSPTLYKADFKLSLASPKKQMVAVSFGYSIPTIYLDLAPGQTQFEASTHYPLVSKSGVAFVQVYDPYTGASAGYTDLKVASIRPTFVPPTSDIQRGKSAQAKVVLNSVVKEPAVISLKSNTDAASFPATVTVPAGAKEVAFPIQGVSNGFSSIEVKFNGNSSMATVWVVSTGIEAVELPGQVVAQRYFTGRVRLIDPAPAGGRIVELASADPGLRTATSVKVPEGQTWAEFSIVSNDVTEIQEARVVARTGDSTATGIMSVKPLAVKAFTLSAATVKGGASVDGTVTLDEIVGVNTL